MPALSRRSVLGGAAALGVLGSVSAMNAASAAAVLPLDSGQVYRADLSLYVGKYRINPGTGRKSYWFASTRVVQYRLGVGIDGVYGPRTRDAVRHFQRSRRLVDDGIVGLVTCRALGLTLIG